MSQITDLTNTTWEFGTNILPFIGEDDWDGSFYNITSQLVYPTGHNYSFIYLYAPTLDGSFCVSDGSTFPENYYEIAQKVDSGLWDTQNGEFPEGLELTSVRITITGGTDVTNSTLITWLQEYGTLVEEASVPISIDLTTLENYSDLTSGETYSVTVVAKGNPNLYIDSDPSTGVNYTVPTPLPKKGDIITARWGNAGTHDWRVLKMNGTVATLADITAAVNKSYHTSINSSGTTITYTDGTSGMSFASTSGSDTYKMFNTNNPSYYSMMTAAMKTAVQTTTPTVHLYYMGSQTSGTPDYYYCRSTDNPPVLYRIAPKESCSYTYNSMNVKSLSVEDIIEYFNLPSNGSFINKNFSRVFLNTDVVSSTYYWLMNASASSPTVYYMIINSNGYISSYNGASTYLNNGYAIPVFNVDLANVEYTLTENEYYYISFAGVGTNVAQNPDSIIKKDGTTTATLTFTANNGYDLPSTITVTGASYAWNSTTGVVTLSNPTDNVMITVNGVPQTYNIITQVSNVTANSGNPSTIQYGSTATLNFTADSGYSLPSSITVSGASYTWDNTTGTVVLTSNTTGNVTVSISGVPATVSYAIAVTTEDNGYIGDVTLTINEVGGSQIYSELIDYSSTTTTVYSSTQQVQLVMSRNYPIEYLTIESATLNGNSISFTVSGEQYIATVSLQSTNTLNIVVNSYD